MIFPLLECLKGFEARILVIQPDHETDVHAILVQVIKKAAAIDTAVERPAGGVLNEPGLHPSRGQLPQLLESQSVCLRRFTGIELEAGNQLLGGAAAAAFTKHGDLRVDFRTQSKIGAGLAILRNAHIPDANALDGAR